jgi:hypothetical protein
MRRSSLLLLPSTTLACIQYSATYPFDPELPFEAFISSNDTVVCWISRTYNEHNRVQNLANLAPVTREQLAHPDELTWGFQRWDFTCVEGHQGWANVGVRSMGYIGTDGKVTQWVADMIEDVWDEYWEYWKEIGCVEERRERIQREMLERTKGARASIEKMEKQKAEENGKKEGNEKMEDVKIGL